MCHEWAFLEAELHLHHVMSGERCAGGHPGSACSSEADMSRILGGMPARPTCAQQRQCKHDLSIGKLSFYGAVIVYWPHMFRCM